MIVDADVVQDPAEARKATPMPSGPLKPPNWPPPFRCGSKSRNTPGMPRRWSFCSKAGRMPREIAEDGLVAAVAHVGRHEILHRVLSDVAGLVGGARMAVVLDVHPAQSGLHRLILLEQLGRRKALGRMLAASKTSTMAGMVHLPVDLGQKLAVGPTRLASISRPKVRSARWQASAIWPN